MTDDAPKIQQVKNFDQLYAGRFLKSGDLDGKKVTVTIDRVWREEIQGDDGKKMKATLSFKETDRQMIACKTNGLCMKALFGPNIADWIGKRITLFADTWNGEPALRLWGSPDIAEDMEITIALPRKKAFKKTMHKVVIGGKITPKPADDAAEPGSDG